MYVKSALSAAAAALMLAVSSTAAFAEKPPDAGRGHSGTHGHSAQSSSPTAQSGDTTTEPANDQPGPAKHEAPASPGHQDHAGPAQRQEPSGPTTSQGDGRSDGDLGHEAGAPGDGGAGRDAGAGAARDGEAGPQDAAQDTKGDTALGGSETGPKPEQDNQHTGPGDDNRGDIWIDAPGALSEPGHEHDPQLGCGPFQVYGANLADASGTFAIYAWPPTGHKSLAYDGQWSSTGTAVQVISAGQPISLPDGHYKVTVVQDPVKHKTFWVRCGGGSTGGETDSGGGDHGTDGDHDKQTDSGQHGQPHKHVDYGYKGGSVSPLQGASSPAVTADALSAASRQGVQTHIAGAVGTVLANTGFGAVGLLLAGLVLAVLGLMLVRRTRRAS